MLKHHRQQFGIDLTEDGPGFLTLPAIKQAIFFPQFEEQFDLPPGTQRGKDLLGVQASSGHRGEDRLQ